MPECLIVQPIHRAGLDRLREGGVTARLASAPDMATVAREVAGCAAAITRNAGFDAAAFEAARELRVLANHGVGTNRIALGRAADLGILVVNTPTANARSVAEHAIALILALARKVTEADAAVRAEDWRLRYEARMTELHGRILGLAGFGTIGRMTAAIARQGFGMRLLVFSPGTPDGALAEAGAARAPTLDALLEGADILSLHRPLRPDTRHMLDAAAIGKLRPGALVVNTARGELVDTAAMAAALRAGRVGGFATDVFAEEPPRAAAEPILSAPNTILAPHIAGVTEAALRATALACAEQILDVLAGRRPAHLVPPTAWERRRA